MEITSPEKIEWLTEQIGILPFFTNPIEGFSIEEHTPEDFWFNKEKDGPWEWKGPIIANFKCAYGKFFDKKAGYIRLDLLALLSVFRRAMYQKENFTPLEQNIYNAITQHEALRSDVLKDMLGLGSKKRPSKSHNPIDNLTDIPILHKSKEKKSESIDTAITQLQMGTWIVCADFEYSYTKEGKRYGWGKAVYTTPEALYGEELMKRFSDLTATEARQMFCETIAKKLEILIPNRRYSAIHIEKSFRL